MGEKGQASQIDGLEWIYLAACLKRIGQTMKNLFWILF